jgi:hypothetical protein
MKICILVCTYNRNKELFRLLHQINNCRNSYSGNNEYVLVVADSNSTNASLVENKEILNYDFRIVNPSVGFDANIHNFYSHHSSDFDYTLSISDDDLFNVLEIHPFDIIDLSLKSKPSVVLFSHVDLTFWDDSKARFIRKCYLDSSIMLGKEYLLNYFLRTIPRHVGILYSKNAIQSALPVLPKFFETNHLYCVPFFIAALKNEVLFFDYPVFLFSDVHGTGGAWQNLESVFYGLIKFLIEIRPLISEHRYAIARQGFCTAYFEDSAPIRIKISENGIRLPSFDVIKKLL